MDNSVGRIFRKARKSKEWTVAQLLEALALLDLHIGYSHIINIETSYEVPSPETLVKIAKVLDLDPEVIIEVGKRSKLKEYRTKLDQKYNEARKKYHTK